MASIELRQYVSQLNKLVKKNGITEEYAYAYYQAAIVAIETEKDIDYGLKLSNCAKKSIEKIIYNSTGGGSPWDLDIYCFDNDVKYAILDKYYNIYHLEAPYLFESYLFYMEKKRKPQKRFYLPRKETLGIVVQDLQDLEDGKLKFYGLSLPPRVGKSTICIFFLSWVIGRKKESHNAMSGHSGTLADHFYDEILKLTTSDDYTFNEIFPDCILCDKSGEYKTLKYNKTESFDSLVCRGIDGTWTGAVDISSDGYLYVDDMVRDRTESLSPKRLEKRYQDYLNVLVDRKNDGSKELMVGTRWNLLDPLGRVKSQYKDNPLYRFREIPALDENDNSNFVYDFGVGFSAEYYIDIRNRLDPNEWQAKYQQKPYVREGLLFPLDELRYYNGVLPEGGHINASACDVAWGGGDSVSMPFGTMFGYDGDIYITDWVFNNNDKYVTRPLVVSAIIKNKPNKVKFEADNGGDEYAEAIDKELRNQNHITNITWAKASNKISKMAKIIQYAADIKRRCLFIAPELQSPEYRKAMEELGMTVQLGNNEHDDAADGLTQTFLLFEEELPQTKVIKSPI